LNDCQFPVFNVDKRGVRDHIGNIQNRHKKKIKAEEKATGIAPDEPSDLDDSLEQIIALEESSEAEVQDASAEKKAKLEKDKAKAEDIRLKAMEKLSNTKKRASEDEFEGSKSTRKRRSGADGIAYLSERAGLNYELKEKELELKREEKEIGRKQLEASVQQQFQQQQQQTAMMTLLQDQHQQYQQQQTMLLQQQQQQTANK
jgi:hypothetical protein